MLLERLDILKDFNEISVVTRLFLAMVIGVLLGAERERKRRPAGLRTYILVCVGSALATITSIYMGIVYSGVDPSRIPAQIISGIGFLGAGTIIVTKIYRVKGLTTAAGLWCCAAVGMAAGAGFYTGAILTGLIIIISLRLFALVDRKYAKYNIYIHCYVEYKSRNYIRNLIIYAKQNKYLIHDMDMNKDSADGIYFGTFQIKLDSPDKREDVLSELQELPDCIVIEEIEE